MTLAHAPLFPPTADPVLLLIIVMVAPQPPDVGPWKKQELSDTGKMQAVGGGVTGGAAHAVARAATGREFSPISRRKYVGTELLNWHWTAFTREPSREGVKVEPFQIPRTMLS